MRSLYSSGMTAQKYHIAIIRKRERQRRQDDDGGNNDEEHVPFFRSIHLALEVCNHVK